MAPHFKHDLGQFSPWLVIVGLMTLMPTQTKEISNIVNLTDKCVGGHSHQRLYLSEVGSVDAEKTVCLAPTNYIVNLPLCELWVIPPDRYRVHVRMEYVQLPTTSSSYGNCDNAYLQLYNSLSNETKTLFKYGNDGKMCNIASGSTHPEFETSQPILTFYFKSNEKFNTSDRAGFCGVVRAIPPALSIGGIVALILSTMVALVIGSWIMCFIHVYHVTEKKKRTRRTFTSSNPRRFTNVTGGSAQNTSTTTETSLTSTVDQETVQNNAAISNTNNVSNPM